MALMAVALGPDCSPTCGLHFVCCSLPYSFYSLYSRSSTARYVALEALRLVAFVLHFTVSSVSPSCVLQVAADDDNEITQPTHIPNDANTNTTTQHQQDILFSTNHPYTHWHATLSCGP